MPRLPIDYANTVIYKLVCNDLSITDCYVGHTTDFVRRKRCHKSNCSNEKGKKYDNTVYKTIREIGGWDNWSMIEIEKYPCKDANEATSKEREWFERLDSSLNMCYPQRGVVEYTRVNRDKILLQKLQYDKENRDSRILKQRQWYQENRNEELLRHQIYRENNKEKIALTRKEMFICECGSAVHKWSKLLHSKSIFHKQHMERVMLGTDLTIPIERTGKHISAMAAMGDAAFVPTESN